MKVNNWQPIYCKQWHFNTASTEDARWLPCCKRLFKAYPFL